MNVKITSQCRKSKSFNEKNIGVETVFTQKLLVNFTIDYTETATNTWN